MKSFVRDDGQPLRVIEGLRERVLSYRPSVSPRADWTDTQFAVAATKRQKRYQRLLASFTRWMPTLEGARVLDVGCGDGANCVLLAAEPIRLAVGLDLHLRLFTAGVEGQQTRRLVEEVSGRPTAKAALAGRLGFVDMDATRLGFRRQSFDLVMSRSAAEHIKPIEVAL